MDGNESDGSDNGFEDQSGDDERDSGRPGGHGGPGGGGPGNAGGPQEGVPGNAEGPEEDGGGPDGGRHDDNNGNGRTGEETEGVAYDISIAASHSYLGPGLVELGGRAVLEAGWRGRVPVTAHHGVVFPGETVPMLLPHAPDAALLAQAIKRDKLFGLLCPDCPDDSSTTVSGYGVLCEVMMADIVGDETPNADDQVVTFKALAIHRFRLVKVPREGVPVYDYARMRFVEVMVLPEVAARDTLRARLPSLDCLRALPHGCVPRAALPQVRSACRQYRCVCRAAVARRLRGLEAAGTPWPRWVYDMFDLQAMRRTIRAHFRSLALDARLPDEPVALSFWVASNLALSAADRLALFVVDNALQRLHMECLFINKKSVLCCTACVTPIARRKHIFAMSSEGVHSNYTNFGGHMHDILTVSRASNVQLSGPPSAEYSWFPGYCWTVAMCATCLAHVGWRFEAQTRNLRPRSFFGLCRNYVQPVADRQPERSPARPRFTIAYYST